MLNYNFKRIYYLKKEETLVKVFFGSLKGHLTGQLAHRFIAKLFKRLVLSFRNDAEVVLKILNTSFCKYS